MGFRIARLTDVLAGRKPERIPFIDRMDFWQRGLSWQDMLPNGYAGMSLEQVHQALGFGMLEWKYPYSYRYKNLELLIERDGELISREFEPEIFDFPSLWDDLPIDQPGTYTTTAISPAGRLTCEHRMTEEGLRAGISRAIMSSHPVSSPADCAVFAAMIENSELIPKFEPFRQRSEQLQGFGFLTPKLSRAPFQALLIDVFGETSLFYALYDYPRQVEGLLRLLDERMQDLLERLSGLPVPYVEMIDNLEGRMTNPRLFRKYLLPTYQEYARILHGQGKKLGSHLDGDLKPLLGLLAECGLDVCESFTPAPITGCAFEDAWHAWADGPLIWGGIPSYYLEPGVPEDEFKGYVEKVLGYASQRPIILGIGDAVMAEDQIERLAWIVERVEETPVNWD